jgi:predicted TIM-barrel fold metal-dependent hydrolase
MLDQACRDFRTVNFVLGHGGSHYVDDCAMMAAFRPNVYLEFSGFQRAGALKAALARLAGLFDRGLNHKILFGTDFPVFQARLADLTQGLWDEDGPFAALSEKDAAMIARENFMRLWTPAVTWDDSRR